MAKLRITYRKSTIGYSQDQKDTVRSLGLRKLNSVVVHPDNASLRGMLFKVKHLVTVEEVADSYAEPTRAATVRPTIVAAGAPATPAKPARQAATLAPAITLADQGDGVAEVVTPDNPAASDDLELIEGIGPKIAGVLVDAGVTTFAQLADMSPEQITSVVQAGGVRLFQADTWPEQARLAASGRMDELKALQDRLTAGRASS